MLLKRAFVAIKIKQGIVTWSYNICANIMDSTKGIKINKLVSSSCLYINIHSMETSNQRFLTLSIFRYLKDSSLPHCEVSLYSRAVKIPKGREALIDPEIVNKHLQIYTTLFNPISIQLVLSTFVFREKEMLRCWQPSPKVEAQFNNSNPWKKSKAVSWGH